MKLKFYSLLSLLAFTTAAIAQVKKAAPPAKAAAPAAEKKSIVPPFEHNQSYMLNSTVVTEAYNGKVLQQKQTITCVYALTATANDPATGIAKIAVELIEQHTRREDVANKEVTGYNSDKPDEYVTAGSSSEERKSNKHYREFYDGLLKKSFEISFNTKTGTIESVSGYDAIIEKALMQLTDDDAEYLKGYREGIKSGYNEKAVKAELQAAFDYLPGKPVGTGDTWSKADEIEGSPVKMAYAVKSVQADTLKVSAVSTTAVNKEYKVTMSKKTSVVLNPVTGLLISNDKRTEVKGLPNSGNKFLMIKTEKYTVDKFELMETKIKPELSK